MTDTFTIIGYAILFFASFGLSARVIYRNWKFIKSGQKEEINVDFKTSLHNIIHYILLQKKLYKKPARGIFHVFIMYGFLVFGIHTLSQFIGAFSADTFFYIPALFGHTAENIYDLSLDVFSVLVFIGIMYFAYRRYVLKAVELDRPSFQSLLIIVMLSVLMVFTLIGEPAKLIINNTNSISPIRNFIASFYVSMGWSDYAKTIYLIGWWGHAIFVLPFVFIIPDLKHAHLFWSAINYWNTAVKPKGEMKFLDTENALVWGAACVQDFTWKKNLEALSCIECGRCTLECPANRTGKALNPKKIMINIKHSMIKKMPVYLNLKNSGKTNEELAQNNDLRIIDNVISKEEIWACTTCYACVEACPVGNNQMEAILEMRRSLVLNEGSMPAELQTAMENIENQQNPWGLGSHKREEWAEGLGLKTMASMKENSEAPDVLFWVGCAGAFDDRAKKIARTMASLLLKAGVNFAILGQEESCTGDSARRAGNEYLFQMMAQNNIEILNNYNIKEIITFCPHCFNTLKNEYPQMGGNYKVYHHSRYLVKLVEEKKLKINKNIYDITGDVVYHDSCYLGRYQNNFENPRKIIAAACGKEALEAQDNKTTGLCCGAGGAQMWKEEEKGNERVSIKRTKQLLAANTKTIATACPFCMTMISDGIKSLNKEESTSALDIAEILEKAVV
ncbi:MAG: (Fe-S)-binding protein [Spirochaetia bacterium]|nr:(Fe-S)-binding protein [Spirochaetia bacterium]